MPDEGSVTGFFEGLRAGDDRAVAELWGRYFPRLVALARKTLADRPQRVADAEDAAASALASFWRRSAAGEFPGELHRDDLWNLLGLITVRKARKQVVREMALKRGGGRVFPESAVPAGDTGVGAFRLDRHVGALATHELDVEFAERLEALDPEFRAIVALRLLGHSTREIADELDCTQRKVQRKLELLRLIWTRELE